VTTRDRIVVMVVAAVAALAGFWFLVLAPKRAEVARLDGELATQQQRLQTAQAGAATATRAKADYQRNYATVATLGKAVPADDDMPSLLVQLESVSKGDHIDFESLKLAGTGTGAATAAPAPAAPAATGAETKDNTAPASDTAAAASSPAASSTLPPGATVGTAGLGTMPFSFVFTGSYFDLQRFVGAVQALVRPTGDNVSVRGRLLTIEGISLTPGASGMKRIKASVSATGYIVPAGTESAAASGATAATPDAAGSAGSTAAGAATTSSAVTPGAS
jgi:Tfp pilus assembly protein PilO